MGNQSSTYVEFKLKRKDSSNIDEGEKGIFSRFFNAASSNVRTFYHQTKEFILHRTVFLIIAGILGMPFLLIFIILIFLCLALVSGCICAIIVAYLRFCQGSTLRFHAGFRRYEPLLQDEYDSLITEKEYRKKRVRNTHVMASESDDEEDQTLFSSRMKNSETP